MIEVYDVSDLKAEIEVWFCILAFYAPNIDWSWNNPTLRSWMERHGYHHRRDIPPAGLWLISWSLKRRYEHYRGVAQLTGQEVL